MTPLSPNQLSTMAAICFGSSIKEIAYTRGVTIRAIYGQAMRCKRKMELDSKMRTLKAARLVCRRVL
jgi:DNA-binding NarL/FixJ family response regulator